MRRLFAMLLLFLQQAAVDSSDYTTSAAIPVVRFTEHDFRLHPAYERPAVLALSREEVRHALTIHNKVVGFSPATIEASHACDPGVPSRIA